MSGASGSHHSVPQALIYIARPSRKNIKSPLISSHPPFSLCILVDSCCVLLLSLEEVATSLSGDLFCFTVLPVAITVMVWAGCCHWDTGYTVSVVHTMEFVTHPPHGSAKLLHWCGALSSRFKVKVDWSLTSHIHTRCCICDSVGHVCPSSEATFFQGHGQWRHHTVMFHYEFSLLAMMFHFIRGTLQMQQPS